MSSAIETARSTAAIRARETRRPDRLFADPWAELLAGDITADESPNVVIRTRFFDEFLAHATSDSDCDAAIHQVVVVGSGMDTRAFRQSWPEGTHLYELDRPEVLERKDRLLWDAGARPACERHSVGVDLIEGWTDALEQAGFDRTTPSVWLAEGFLVYLEEPHVRGLLLDFSRLAARASRLGLDVPNRAFLTSPWTKPTIEMMRERGTPYRFAIDRPEELLTELGWAAKVTVLGDTAANYGRWPYPVAPRETPGVPSGLLVTATRLDATDPGP